MPVSVLFLSCGTLKEPTDVTRTISTIQDNGSKYCIYDQKGKKVTCLAKKLANWKDMAVIGS